MCLSAVQKGGARKKWGLRKKETTILRKLEKIGSTFFSSLKLYLTFIEAVSKVWMSVAFFLLDPPFLDSFK